jgi:hypothetical protein
MRLSPILLAQVAAARIGAATPMNARTTTLKSQLAQMRERDKLARFPQPLYQPLQAPSYRFPSRRTETIKSTAK